MNNFKDLCPGCGDCRELCPFLAEYGTPDRILRERPEVAFYCTSCRRCDGVCPEGLSPSAAFFDVKRRMVRQDAIAPAVRNALDGARRFAKAGHTSLFSFYQSTDTVFWPGCGLAANRPGVVRKVKKILSRRLHRQVGLVLDCCHDPVYGLGDTETAFAVLREIGKRLRDHSVRQVITGCLNCHKLLSEHLEGIQVIFILEALPAEIFERRNMDSVYLHHPCPSSRWKVIQDKARGLVDHIHAHRGTDLKSTPVSESANALCCGSGGNLGALQPGLADRFLESITGKAENKTIVTYCTGCQNRFLKQGAKAVHLLEWLPGVQPRRTIPSPLVQWVNRFFLALATRVQTGKFPAGIIVPQPFLRRFGKNKAKAIRENRRTEERK